MNENALNEEALGFGAQDEARRRIIEEVTVMRRSAIETGNERHLPAMDRIEEAALRATNENYMEEEAE